MTLGQLIIFISVYWLVMMVIGFFAIGISDKKAVKGYIISITLACIIAVVALLPTL